MGLPMDTRIGCNAGFAAIVALWCLGATPSHAIILAGGDQSVNTTPPADDPGWYNVGQHGGGSAVYLSDRWVITADHLSLQDTISFNGIPVPVETGSEIVLSNPDGLGLSELTDLRLVRLTRSPVCPP